MADSPRTVGETGGDGVSTDFYSYNMTLDGTTNPTTVTIEGNVQGIGGSMTAISGSPLTAPSIPGSGSTYWIVQLNTTTGAASIKSSSSATPAADAGNIVIFSGQLNSTDTSLAQETVAQTVDAA